MTPSPIEEEAVLFAMPEIVLPTDSASVVRWVSAGEAECWEKDPLSVPTGLRPDDGWLPVAEPGTPKPAGTGTLRLEFCVPAAMLVFRQEAGWLYLKPGSAVFNLRIVGPRSFLSYET